MRGRGRGRRRHRRAGRAETRSSPGDRRLEPGQPPVVEVRAMREAEILAAGAHGGRAARLEDLGAERGRGVERDAVPSRLEEEELVAAALEDEEPIAKRRGERLVEP